MTGFMDFFNVYIMGSVQMLFGFYFFVRFLHKKVAFHFYLLFAVCGMAVIHFVPAGRIAEFGAYVLLLMVSGILICHADWKSAVLYTALVVEVMQLCYGIVNSLWGILHPLTLSFDQRKAGIAFMLAGDTVSLLLSGLCYYMIYRYFFHYEAIRKQYVFIVLIPVLEPSEFIHKQTSRNDHYRFSRKSQFSSNEKAIAFIVKCPKLVYANASAKEIG